MSTHEKYLGEAKMTDEEKGTAFAEWLQLKKKGDRYMTSWGDKTAKGLWLSAKRMVMDLDKGKVPK